MEKRLGRIEAYLAKLAKGSKSKSEQVHMATAHEQSDPIFSDDDTSKPEDNNYNSDNSSAGSDSGKRDMNVYITYEKKVKCNECAEQSRHSNKPSSFKASNQSKHHKVEQNDNSSPAHNVSLKITKVNECL